MTSSSDSMGLAGLAARCEAASGANYDLEHEIAHVTGYLWADITARIPPYTASLDAAMTLLPDGHDFLLGQGWQERSSATVVHHLTAYSREVFAATPALALCAAALLARAHQEQSA